MPRELIELLFDYLQRRLGAFALGDVLHRADQPAHAAVHIAACLAMGDHPTARAVRVERFDIQRARLTRQDGAIETRLQPRFALGNETAHEICGIQRTARGIHS